MLIRTICLQYRLQNTLDQCEYSQWVFEIRHKWFNTNLLDITNQAIYLGWAYGIEGYSWKTDTVYVKSAVYKVLCSGA